MSHRAAQTGVEPEGHEPLEGSYFVSTYPPFSVWTPDQIPRYVESLSRTPDPSSEVPLGLYVHVPFCVKRCPYCYFLAYAETPRDRIGAYLDALLTEAALYAASGALAGREPQFVYFGGGTPSILPAKQIQSLLTRLRALMPWDSVREVTFECAPQTVTREKLLILGDNGVTRLSLGVQQLDDEVLGQSGRVHLVEDVERAYAAIQRVGFDIANVDLMVGLVGETDASFFASLDRIIELAPDSVTMYQLEIPLNTPLYRNLADGTLAGELDSWDTKRRRLAAAFERLEACGYTVRSAYAAVRDPDRHRFVYQEEQYRGADVVGLGVASFSYVSGVHHQNISALEPYLKELEAGRLPLGRAYALSDEERLVRELILQLKLGGVDVESLRSKFGVDVTQRFAAPLSRLVSRGHVAVEGPRLTVTREGLLRVDRFVREFYLPEHRAVRYS